MSIRVQLGLLVIRIFNVVYACLVLVPLRRTLLRVVGCNVGKHTGLHDGVRFTWMGRLTIGNHSTLNMNCFIDSRGGITIGNNSMLGRCTSIYTMTHDVNSPTFSSLTASVIIGNNVIVFPHTIIMPGISIGDDAIVYPGSVVSKNVASKEIVGGVPARTIGIRKQGVNYTLDYTYCFANA